MPSSLDFVEYVCGQISGAGEITYRKMFGEYGVYCNGKIIGLICENQFFVKKTAAGVHLLPALEEVPPYSGAKPYLLVEDLDDSEQMAHFIAATWNELPAPKPKKKK